MKPSAAARVALQLIRAYRFFLSPFFGQQCRFHPTCSAYAALAIERFGFWRGVALALRRIGRCHPFHAGGIDPVPATFRGSEGAASSHR